MDIEKMNIRDIKTNPKNPRIIKNDKYKKLVKSIREFPEMLDARPIVIDDDNIVLGGNMRLKACKEVGLKEVPIIRFKDLSEERKKEFIIKDNVGFGDWDWQMLQSDWVVEDLIEWGLDVKNKKEEIEGEIEFSEELLLEHNYIVLYFDNEMDWQVACDKMDIKKVKNSQYSKRQTIGVGRVINGKKIIDKL